MLPNDIHGVLKAFQDASSDEIIASEAFVSFSREFELFGMTPDDQNVIIRGAKVSSYKHHLTAARKKQTRAILANEQFLKVRGALDEHQSELSGLSDENAAGANVSGFAGPTRNRNELADQAGALS